PPSPDGLGGKTTRSSLRNKRMPRSSCSMLQSRSVGTIPESLEDNWYLRVRIRWNSSHHRAVASDQAFAPCNAFPFDSFPNQLLTQTDCRRPERMTGEAGLRVHKFSVLPRR